MNEEHLNLVRSSLSRRGQAAAGAAGLTPEQLLEKSRITPETVLPPMVNLFRMYEVPCFYRGELVAVCGRAKSGKTLFLSMIMAAGVAPPPEEGPAGVLALEREGEAPLRVLWIDTEQSQQSTQDIMRNRIVPMSRGQSEGMDETFYAYNLRGLGYEKRMELMALAINTVKPDLAVIDGIKDMITDINDAVQATLVMERLMALAQRNNCCIVNVLHQNKSEADRNMRGSIGTELTNKAFEVFQCELIEESETFKVRQTLARRDRIRSKLYYKLNDEGLPTACADAGEQPRDVLGRWTRQKPRQTTADVKWETFNQKYIIHHDDQPEKPYEWNLARLFEDAFEGRSQRLFNQVMGAALRLSHIADKSYYYERFNEAEQRGLIRKFCKEESGETWVEMVQNQLPF